MSELRTEVPTAGTGDPARGARRARRLPPLRSWPAAVLVVVLVAGFGVGALALRSSSNPSFCTLAASLPAVQLSPDGTPPVGELRGSAAAYRHLATAAPSDRVAAAARTVADSFDRLAAAVDAATGSPPASGDPLGDAITDASTDQELATANHTLADAIASCPTTPTS